MLSEQVASKVCETCGGDEVLHDVEWRNGREVEVSEPCPECCGDEDHDDREDDDFRQSSTLAENRDAAAADDMRAEQHERYLRAFGPSFFLTLLVLAVFGCSTTPSNVHPITWSTGKSDSSGVPDPVVCGALISHPCPFLLFTTTLEIDESGTVATLIWGNAKGGANDIGIAAEDMSPYTEGASVDAAGNLMLKQRGDDGGLRLAATIAPTGGGITWTLFNVAGNTTFHLTIGMAS